MSEFSARLLWCRPAKTKGASLGVYWWEKGRQMQIQNKSKYWEQKQILIIFEWKT